MEKLAKIGTVRYPMQDGLPSVIEKELKSKYFLSLSEGEKGGRIWGNSMIEAISSGCLAFDKYSEYVNIDLFTFFTCIETIDDFFSKVKFLENNPSKLKKELFKQRKLVNYLCFIRPIKELVSKNNRFRINVQYIYLPLLS